MTVEDFAGLDESALLGASDLSLLSEAIPHMVWFARPDGYRDFFNRRTLTFTGVAESALIGQGWLQSVHPDDRASTEKRWMDAVRRPAYFEGEQRIRQFDGEYRRVRVRGLPIKRADGTLERWIGTWTDVETERRVVDEVHLAEKRLAEELAVTEALIDASPITYALVDSQYRLVRMNERMAARLGIAPSSSIGRPMAEVLPASWPHAEPHLRQVLESGKPIRDIEETRPDAVGGTVPALVSYLPVRVGRAVVGVGVVEVTDRVAMDEFHKALLDNMNEGLFALDSDGRVTSLNRSAERMLGWRAADAIGRSAHDLWHGLLGDGSVRVEEQCELTRANRGGASIRVEDVFTRSDGVLLPVSYSISLLNDSPQSGVVVVFHDATEEFSARGQAQRAIDTLTWVGRIRDALEEDRLELYSQPIVPLHGGASPAEELLVRLRTTDGGIVLPGTFIPVAERYGLITDIDRWVIHRAARLAATGRRVHANVSAWTIANVDFAHDVEQALQESGTDPDNLVLEITETALMSHFERAEAFARSVTNLGCHLALDDFGTGFGGFTYVTRLPTTYLKIDIEFVRDLLQHPTNQRVVEAIVALAAGLGKMTIAEGVEDAETLEAVRMLGVDMAQGFHLGRPAPLE